MRAGTREQMGEKQTCLEMHGKKHMRDANLVAVKW